MKKQQKEENKIIKEELEQKNNELMKKLNSLKQIEII